MERVQFEQEQVQRRFYTECMIYAELSTDAGRAQRVRRKKDIHPGTF